MQPTRKARIESVLLRETTTAISKTDKDIDFPNITITRLELKPDGRHAIIWFNLLGFIIEENEERHQESIKTALKILQGYEKAIRNHLAHNLDLKYIPFFSFKEDKGLSNSIRVQELLNKISDEK